MTDEYIKESGYIYTTECFSVTRKDEVLSFTATCMGFVGVMISEINQKEKDQMFSLKGSKGKIQGGGLEK